MNEFNDEQLDPRVDRLLQQAFAGRPGGAGGQASLTDVRARARRHQRRRAGGVLGAAAVVGLGGVAVLSQRGDGATTASPGDGGATSTTTAFQNCSTPQQEYPTTTIVTVDTWPADVANTTLLPSSTVTDSTEVQPTYTTVEWPTTTTDPSATTTAAGVVPVGEDFATTTSLLNAAGAPMTTPCQPTGQFRCVGNTGTDDQGYTYFEYCEPTGAPFPTITTITGNTGSVLIVDASGVPGAADDMFNLLSTSGFGAVQVTPGTRTVEQSMLMPTGEVRAGGWEILQQLTHIDGSDTWTSDLIDGELPVGTGVVVVIGQDYWERMGMGLSATTVPVPIGGTTVPGIPTTTTL
jgi:hypothetical protein